MAGPPPDRARPSDTELEATIRNSAAATLERLRSLTELAATVTPQQLRAGSASSSPSSSPSGAWAVTAREGWGDLAFVRELAAGGMGRVLLARQSSLDREVAIKTVRPELASPAYEQALLEESRITGSLEHPNIVPVHSLGRAADGSAFLVMKRVEGVAWSALLDDPQHPAWARASVHDGDRLGFHLDVLSALCAALHYAHLRGVVHRDVKPSNVMVGELGEVYLVDWGVATALDPTDPRYRKLAMGFVGTPALLAPEMIADDGGGVDVRSDVYLLGATLHYVLTRQHRHAAPTLMATLALSAASDAYPYGPEVPEELGAIANRACHRDPAQRFQTAAAFREAVQAFLRHRVSIGLSARARERLDALLSDLSERPPMDAPARARARERTLECLFGFASAHAAWPDNPQARAGLRDCKLMALRDDVADGNLAGAEARLLVLADPPADVVEAVDSLRRETREREAREARLRALDAREDWARSAGARAGFFVATLVLGTGLWLWANGGRIRSPDAIPPERLAAMMGVVTLALGAFLAVMRKRLFASRANEQLAVGALFVVSAMFVSRVANLWPVPYTATMVSHELTMVALGLALGGLVLARWLWALVPLWIVAVAAVRAFPDVAGAIFATCSVVSLLLGLWRARVVAADAKRGAAD